MNRIVRENYPVADLPADLREGFALDTSVTITIEVMPKSIGLEPSLDELMKLPSPPWLTREEIIAQIDELREDRDL